MVSSRIDQFNAELDEVLGLAPTSSSVSDAHTGDVLRLANSLRTMEFDPEASPRAGIRSRWARAVCGPGLARRPSVSRIVWAAILVILVALLAAFYQPVFAAVSRVFGYIYVADVGFLPLDSTYLLEQPILQEHAGQTVTVMRGVATPQHVILFLKFSDTARSADGARLEAASGDILQILQWAYWPNSPNSQGLEAIFPPLPHGSMQTILSLPEGWRLPLKWIPASQANLPNVRAIPYVSSTESISALPDLCVEKHGMNLCVMAATATTENTSVLVQAESRNPDLSPGGPMGMGVTWSAENAPVTLRDSQGNAFTMSAEQGGVLTFPPVAANQEVSLTIPAVQATVNIPEQGIMVDLGDDPQPDTVIPLDQSIQVLGARVHFSQAAFVGDGVNSLRLVLNADDPIPSVDGITPASLELGKPDKVDDLYGAGMLAGSKDIFIELIRPSGKVTGKLTIPVVGASVTVGGPFEFTFNLTDASSGTSSPTPAEANPSLFSPAPSPTPIPMDSYRYGNVRLNSGDLIYTAVDVDKTNVYLFAPDSGGQSKLLATLPGAVSQIYIHPDRQGMDYLAGVSKVQDDISYVDNMRLYTLRFGEAMPRLLTSLPPNGANLIGPAVDGIWSYDGRYALFRLPGFAPGNAGWRYVWVDLSCRESGNCVSQEIPLKPTLDLYKAYFAPRDYRILFTGPDNSGTGKEDIFLLEFNPDHPEQQPVNLTPTFSVGDGINAAAWTAEGKIFTACGEAGTPEGAAYCWLDPAADELTFIQGLKPEFDGLRLLGPYWLSPSGDQLAATLFPEKTQRADTLPELRLLSLDGHSIAELASTNGVAGVAFSPSERYVAYLYDQEQRLEVFDTAEKVRFLVCESTTAHALTWLGWVR